MNTKPIENISCFQKKSFELAGKIKVLSNNYSRSIDWETEGSISDFLDDYFQYCFSASMAGPELGLIKNPYALLAIGDYAYERNCFFPNIKILFLFKEFIPDKAVDLIREVLYPLWDLGLKVHSYTRTVKDCCKLAMKDSRSFFSVYNSRLICGVSLVYSDLHELLRKRIITYKKSEFINGKYLNDLKRHKLYKGYKSILEPDPVMTIGGLSDYHSFFVMAKLRFGIQNKADLKFKGLISHKDYENLCESLEFIRDIIFRIKIQFREKSIKIDTYSKLSKKMRLENKSFCSTSEWFLREITNRFNVIKDIYADIIMHINPKEIQKEKKNNLKKETKTCGLKIRGGMLDFVTVNEITKFPELMITIFRESLKDDIFINPDAKRLIKEFSFLLNSDDIKRYLYFMNEILFLSDNKDSILIEMIRCKVISNIIPGFRNIETLFKIDSYHEIPIDLHLTETVSNLVSIDRKDFSGENFFLKELYEEVKDKKVLLWSSFLHHFGNTKSMDFEDELFETLDLVFNEESRAKKALFIINNHDILDKFTIAKDNKTSELINLTKKLKDLETLNILFLLTVADIKSRGAFGLCEKKYNELELIYIKLRDRMK
ncbi:MAG: hypothetical protein GY714_26890 [Desulfobacterales bacterium]|nr:hypothetical protein [Desulfobacterales bacterium]